MDQELERLVAKARETKVSEEEREAQRISFAYGNSNIENPSITRETVIRESAKLRAEKHADQQ
jgi:hypothetical protein